MLDAPRLPGQDGKTLTWRHTGGNNEGRPSGSRLQKKALFTGCARAFLRNNEDQFLKVGEGSRNKGIKSICFPVF